MDLNSLSKKELVALQKEVATAIKMFDERKKKEAIAAAEAAAKEHGFTLSELTGKKSASKAPAKYANPANTSETWSGRGRRPAWVIAALDSGKDLADLEI